ncbi:hypothetical protein [Colwellia sp. E2M01]|uniref:hypothetical protein n=1 Tax=Colwellia sp. E2M01 TaxID=2841561 RepID=UPI001C081B9E|nr:hypothetical protein [Colwellia sp. E2M01]MBU2869650.1 hypothetical protein [Colwellia sp. E2M01]
MSAEIYLSLQQLSEKYPLEIDGQFLSIELEVTDDCWTKLPESLKIDSVKVNNLYIDLSELQKHKGKIALIKFVKPQGIFHSWKEFLDFKPNLIKCPETFFLLDDNVIYPTNVIEGETKHYLSIIKLVEILIEHADHTENLSDLVVDKVTYLHKSRIDIQMLFDKHDLVDSLDGITAICSYFDDNSHKEQKISILKEALFGLGIANNSENKLSYLIKNFGEFSKRFIENYNLFVSEFSFDEVRKEYEEKKRDYFIKLDEIFSSVQSKMLGIPISLALASFKLSTIVDEKSFWANLFLSISIIVYSAMMIMLIKNQKHSLKALKSEFTSQMNRLKHQYSEQYEKIQDMITDLDNRHDYQKSCLNWFYVMCCTLFIIVIALFLWHLPWKLILGI